MTFNVVISKGFLLLTLRRPITKLQSLKNFVYHQADRSLSNNTRRITRGDLLCLHTRSFEQTFAEKF